MTDRLIHVNGEEKNVAAHRLDRVLKELHYEGDWLATAVNGALVRREDRAACTINHGDRIEILAPRQGG